MAHSEPFAQLTGTLVVYIAPVGSTVPHVAIEPTTPWVEIGCTDGEQSVQHAGALTYFYDNCHQGPVKAVRPEEDVIVAFTLVGLTLENYAYILSAVGAVEIDTGAAPDTRALPLVRGFVPTEYALLFRGEALSPYGAYPGMYVIPRGAFDGEPQPTFAKDGRAGLETEFRALKDSDQVAGDEWGWLIVQAEACIPATSVVISGAETVNSEEENEYTAAILPLDYSEDLTTIAWSPAPKSGQGTLVATYEFGTEEEGNTITLTVTVTVCGVAVEDEFEVLVQPGS